MVVVVDHSRGWYTARNEGMYISRSFIHAWQQKREKEGRKILE